MKDITVKRKGHTRRAYLREDGVRVKAVQVAPATFRIEDRGKPGKTPEKEQWFDPQVETGWEKGLSPAVRRAKVLRAHRGDELASARGLQALANVSTDRETAKKAGQDAKVFFRLHRVKQGGVTSRRMPRITPRRPKLRR